MYYKVSFFLGLLDDFYFKWVLFHFSHYVVVTANRRAAANLRVPITPFPSFSLTVFFFPIHLHGLFNSISLMASVPSFVLQQFFHCIALISKMFTTQVSHTSYIPNVFITHPPSLFSCSDSLRSQVYLYCRPCLEVKAELRAPT